MPRLTHGRRELRAQVGEVLRALGASKDEVARQLESCGVRGRPGHADDCALAVYLSAVVASDPRVRAVCVLPTRALVRLDRWWRPHLAVRLPKVLRQFVWAFDARQYPALVRPGGEADGSARWLEATVWWSAFVVSIA